MAVRIMAHVERAAASFVDALMAEEPAILVEGPRGSGKSTLLRSIAAARGGAVLDPDDPATARLVAEDPAGAVGGRPGLVLSTSTSGCPTCCRWSSGRSIATGGPAASSSPGR